MGSIVDDIVSVSTFGLVDTDFSGEEAGKRASDAAIAGANISAQAQREALNYLKETEALPQEFRESALQQLGGMFGVPGGDVSSEQALAKIEASPVFKGLLGDQDQIAEDVLRYQAATGAGRTGATELALGEAFRKNRADALLGTIQGIQGMARLPSSAPQIAQGMRDIGSTQAQGVTASAQARLAAEQAGMQNLLGLGQLGVAAFCDPRLKSNARKIDEINGVQIYEWDWNEAAKEIGLTGKGVGPMADEVARIWPDRVREKFGYMYVEAA